MFVITLGHIFQRYGPRENEMTHTGSKLHVYINDNITYYKRNNIAGISKILMIL